MQIKNRKSPPDISRIAPIKTQKHEEPRSQYAIQRQTQIKITTERLTRVKAQRYGCSFLQELVTKRARHACLYCLPLHFHHLTRHFSLSFSLTKPH